MEPAHKLQLYHPRLLEYVGTPESAGLLSRPLAHWIETMDREEAVSAALQLQHDAGLIMSNLQVLGQFVTSLDRMASEVMRLAFGQEQFPSVAIQAISPLPSIRRAAHYMAAMGLWHPRVARALPGLCRLLHAITVCGVLIASRPWTNRTMSPGGEFSVHMNFSFFRTLWTCCLYCSGAVFARFCSHVVCICCRPTIRLCIFVPGHLLF